RRAPRPCASSTADRRPRVHLRRRRRRHARSLLGHPDDPRATRPARLAARPSRAIVGALISPSVPFRDTCWNVPVWAQVALYVGAALAIAVLVYGLWQRIGLWRDGGPEARLDRIGDRVKLVVLHALGQVRTLSQAYPGVMHAIMFWGFLALFMGT